MGPPPADGGGLRIQIVGPERVQAEGDVDDVEGLDVVRPVGDAWAERRAFEAAEVALDRRRRCVARLRFRA